VTGWDLTSINIIEYDQFISYVAIEKTRPQHLKGFIKLLKRIKTSQLTLGMHLHTLCAPWVRHPFWKSDFKLTFVTDIEKIQESGIDKVIIDISKGADVLVVSHEISPAILNSTKASHKIAAPIESELKRAITVYNQSKNAIRSMFDDVRMGKALDVDSAEIVVSEISASIMENSTALISLMRLKNANEYTYIHSVSVCALMIATAKAVGLNEVQCKEAGVAGLLHDIGKMSIPNAIINKTGPLTDQEFEIIRTHPQRGYSILKEQQQVTHGVLDVCLHHHEKIDGTGYPIGLKKEQISTLVRIASICDVYDAVTSNRPYKLGWDPAEALKKMAQWDGHFDKKIFQIFVKVIGIYPIGSFVKLENDKMGIVYQQNSISLLKPKVKLFFCSKRNIQIPLEDIDLSDNGRTEKIIGVEDPEKWGLYNTKQYWAGDFV
jgi:putative nucleotidyltransferase with HDIG domain